MKNKAASSLLLGLVGIAAAVLPAAVRAAGDDPPPYYFSTLAGASNIGSADGQGQAARFHNPSSAVFDQAGNLWVADTYNHTIRRITADGTATTFAGLAGFSGAADGTGGAARFHYPAGLAVDGAGNLYVADARNSTIRRITPAGVVTTLAGSPGIPGSVDGAGSDARFDHPQGIALDAAGNLYVADSNNATIRKIAVDGTVTTLAGTAQSPGSSDGTGAAARFRLPAGLVVDATGNVYVADAFNHTIRRITPAGTVSTLAGLAENPGATDGLGSAARFAYPQGVTLDPAGNLYVADGGNSTIRRIDLGGQVTTVAGAAGNSGSADGAGSAARFIFPCSVAVSATSVIFVTDTYNSTIRSVTPNGMVTTFAGSADSRGSTGGTGGAARFAGPQGVAVDGAGNVYVADTHNHTVRRIAAAGVVTTLAGSPGAISADPVTGQLNGTYADGTGSAARLFSPAAVAVDGAGTVFVADTGNHIIRRITGDGVVTTFAGLAGTFGTDDGAGGAARFFEPAGLTVDSAGNLYVADTRNHTIRRITPAGVVTTLAGQALASGSADGTGSEARFNQPSGLALDGAGNLYVADSYNHTIRRVTPVGAVTTLAGLAGASGSLDGTGSAARFDTPRGLGIDRSGDLYLADSSNHTFRRITPAGVVTTLAGKNGTDGSADGIGNSARFFHPTCVALDDSGCAYVTDSFNNTIRKGQLAGPPVTTIQPQSLSVAAGAVVEFSVSAVAVPAPTYQWYFNGNPFTGATDPTLRFTNARPADAGDYNVIVTNPLGSVSTAKAILTVTSTPAQPPPPASGGSGGGGAPSGWFLAALAALGLFRRFGLNPVRRG